MGADYSFYVKSIAIFALTFFGYTISVLASVPHYYWPLLILGPLTALNLLGSTGDAGLSQRKSFPAEIETTLNESRPFFFSFFNGTGNRLIQFQ